MVSLLERSPSYYEKDGTCSPNTSLFDDAPDSPKSWNFDVSVSEQPLTKNTLNSELRKCAVPEEARTANYEATANAKSASFALLTGIPPKSSVPLVPTSISTKPSTISLGREILSIFPERPESEALIKETQLRRGQPNLRQTEKKSSRSIPKFPKPNGLAPAFASPQTLPKLPSVPLSKLEENGDKLKIKITCPDQGEILAVKILKNRLSSLRELTDVVCIKLNMRYCIPPDNVSCQIVFPDKSLEAIQLGSSLSKSSLLLEDLVMEYIWTRPRIYIEARINTPGSVKIQ